MSNKHWKDKQRCHLCDRVLIIQDVLNSRYSFTLYQPNGDYQDFRFPKSKFWRYCIPNTKVKKTCLLCYELRNPLYYKYAV